MGGGEGEAAVAPRRSRGGGGSRGRGGPGAPSPGGSRMGNHVSRHTTFQLGVAGHEWHHCTCDLSPFDIAWAAPVAGHE